MNEGAKSSWRMPAEWERHAGTWVSWPHNSETWPDNLMEAQQEFLALVDAIAADEFVYICCDEQGSEAYGRCFANTGFDNLAKAILVQVPTNDAWARDYAPTFVVTEDPSGKPRPRPGWFPKSNHYLAAVNWQYNAWGGKYPPYDLDQQAAAKIALETGMRRTDSNLILEGGAIEVNGTGVLLTTRSCLLNPNRNPNTSIEDIEAELKSKLGLEHVIWLSGDAIIGDDTDGHIDQMARFVNETTIVHAWAVDDADPQSEALKKNIDELRAALTHLQLDYQLVPLPLPAKAIRFGKQRLPASYCNFVITNGSVIVPQFGDEHDKLAVATLGEFFPKRKIVGLPSNNLSVGLGSFHCLTQQMPMPNTSQNNV